MNLFHGYKFNYLFQEAGTPMAIFVQIKFYITKYRSPFVYPDTKGLFCLVKITGKAGNGSKRKHARNHPLPGGRRHAPGGQAPERHRMAHARADGGAVRDKTPGNNKTFGEHFQIW